MKLLEEMDKIKEFFLKHVFAYIRDGKLLEATMKDNDDVKITQEYNVEKIIEYEEILHEDILNEIPIIAILNEILIPVKGSTK